MVREYSKIKYFESIPAVTKKDMILARLNYRPGVTKLDSGYLSMLEEGVRLGSLLCRPMGAYLHLTITEKNESCVKLSAGLEFQSQSLSKLLKNSHEIILMASTVGREVTETVFKEVESGNAAMAVIIDSVASQTADAALDWMVQLLNRMLAREGKQLTRHRYSPGFGDLPLSYQKEIFGALKLERFEMELTEKYMLVPEKSVIAIAGVEGKEVE